jgi:hypothetical protein
MKKIRMGVLFSLAAVSLALTACSSGPDGAGGGGTTNATPGETTSRPAPTNAKDAAVGFWVAGPVSCGGAFEIAYGMAMCSTGKVSALEQVAAPGKGTFKWLGQGNYSAASERLTLSLQRTVIEPSPIAGDKNNATLVLEWDKANDKLVVVEATDMPECQGLELKREDTVVDDDCEPATGGGSDDGCTADADCDDCERCERSTGRCIRKLTC